VPLKDPKDWKLIGKPIKRLDTADKLTGKAIYGADFKLPGMLNATIKECPVFGGKVKSFDAAKVTAMKGVKKVVQVGDTAVAVVADTWWQAKTALDALPIVWDEGENAKVSSASIAEISKPVSMLIKRSSATRMATRKRDRRRGEKGRGGLCLPPMNHAPMEPMNATARYTPDRCEVWCGTQNGEAAFAATLAASGLPADKCDVYKFLLGGAFGRRGAFHDYVTQAVLIAKQMPGTPVKLLWTREEDMTQGRYHPVTQCKLTGAFDASNNLDRPAHAHLGQSILTAVRPEALQNGRTPPRSRACAERRVRIRLRSSESADRPCDAQPACAAGFLARREHQPERRLHRKLHGRARAFRRTGPARVPAQADGQHPKHLAVLNAVAEKAGWGKPAPNGIFRGLAQMKAFNSYVAACAEISVSGDNKVKVQRIVCATDPGYAVNPAQIERQIAGSFVYGLSAVFDQECTVKDGRIEQTNFNTFNSMRIAQMPKVEAIVMPSGGFWGGVGEPTICVAAPAVLNAYFAATGKRIRSFPLKKPRHHNGLIKSPRNTQRSQRGSNHGAVERVEGPDSGEKQAFLSCELCVICGESFFVFPLSRD
jgi:isoquinoline 1-oxidoreductase beta subunit